jgi:hypothetical protein
VTREEVAEALGEIVSAARVCMPFPTLWVQADDRHAVFIVRYDLMRRDWGGDVASASELRMSDFVELGFLTQQERPDLGAHAVEYTITDEGDQYMQGSPEGRERPSFCAPGGRRLVEITTMESGRFACGTLRVRFTHVADGWPAWARTQASRTRVAETTTPVGVIAEGSVSLGRQWYRTSAIPDDVRSNGRLRSLCYSTARQRVTGDDLNLSPGPAQ